MKSESKRKIKLKGSVLSVFYVLLAIDVLGTIGLWCGYKIPFFESLFAASCLIGSLFLLFFAAGVIMLLFMLLVDNVCAKVFDKESVSSILRKDADILKEIIGGAFEYA